MNSLLFIFLCLPIYLVTSIPLNVVLDNQVDGLSSEPSEHVLYDGDILLTLEQLKVIKQTSNEDGRIKRQAATALYATKWTNNTVYFYFDSSLDEKQRRFVLEAQEYIQGHTCINFVENPMTDNRIRVMNGNRCQSAIGMRDGEQTLTLHKKCSVFMNTAAHELMHALGMWHAFMRSDREKYIKIEAGTDVPENLTRNFEHLDVSLNHLYVPFDYGTIMQYQASTNGEYHPHLAMVATDERYLYTLGSPIISFYDIEAINIHYGCHETCSVANSAQCENGGVPNPRNCSECNCPLGYGGVLCDEIDVSSGCGGKLEASEEWQSKRIQMGDDKMHDNLTFCNHWITAPAGAEIEVRVANLEGNQDIHGCLYNGIEIKIEADKRITSPRLCSKKLQNQVVKSALNPTPVITYNRVYYFWYDLEYRFVWGPETMNTTVTVTTTSEEPTTSDSEEKWTATEFDSDPNSRHWFSTECMDKPIEGLLCHAFKYRFIRGKTGCDVRGIGDNVCKKTCGRCDSPVPPRVPVPRANCKDEPGFDSYCRWLQKRYINDDWLPFNEYNGCDKEEIANPFCAKTCGYCTPIEGETAPDSNTHKETLITPRCEDMQMCHSLIKWDVMGSMYPVYNLTDTPTCRIVPKADVICRKTCGFC